MHRISILVAVLVALLVAGCASASPPSKAHPPCIRFGVEFNNLAARQAFGCALSVSERLASNARRDERRIRRMARDLERLADAAEKASRFRRNHR